MPAVDFTNLDIDNTLTGSLLDGTIISVGSGETYPFESLCDLAKFLTESGGNIYENIPGETVDPINRMLEKEGGCAYRVTGIPVPATDGPPTPGIPQEGDTPEAQGAPSVDTKGIVDVQHSPPGDPGDTRQPTEKLHDSMNPQSEGEVFDGEMAGGATDSDAEDSVESARRGEPPKGDARTTHSGEQNSESSQGGDPVDLFSGLFQNTSVDMDVPTPFMPIQLIRHYRSGRPYYGPWGFNWDHNWNIFLRELSNGDVVRWNSQMHEDRFRFNGIDFDPPNGVFEQLIQEVGLGLRYTINARGGVAMTFEYPAGWTDVEKIPLVTITDRSGNIISLKYDTDNRLESVRDGDGRGLYFLYGPCDLLVAVEDHAGRRVVYNFDYENEHMVTAWLPATSDFSEGTKTCYEYDTFASHIARRHNILRVIEHDNNTVLQNFYGEDPSQVSFNRVVRQFAGDYLYSFEYKQIQYVPSDPHFINIAAMQTAVCYPNGALWTHIFNYRGDLLDERYRLNMDGSFRVVISKQEYDMQGNLAAKIAPNGVRIEYTYDHTNANPRMRGNLLKVEMRPPATFPIMSRIMFEARYEPIYQMPNLIIVENRSQTHYFYDSTHGNLEKIEWPDATLPDGTIQKSTTTFESNSRGQITAIISPEGTRNEMVYEPAGSSKAGFLREYREDVAGSNEITHYDYDTFGYLSERIEPGGAIKKLHYNAVGLLEEEILPAVNGVRDKIIYHYNAQHKLAEVHEPRGSFTDSTITGNWIINTYKTNPLGHLTEVTVGANTDQPRIYHARTDFAGRVCELTDPQGVIFRQRYDERNLLLFETIAAGTSEEMTTRFTYDTTGRMTQMHQPGERVTKLEYDPWGRIKKVTKQNRTIINNSWGPFDFLETRTIEGYPGNGSPNRVLSKTTLDYDERGRLIKETVDSFATDPATAIPLSTIKWYDRDGRCTQRVGVRGAVRYFSYDGKNRVTFTKGPLGNIQNIKYGRDGFPQRITYQDVEPSGTRTRSIEFKHDARGRMDRTIYSPGVETVNIWDARDMLIEKRNEAGIVTQTTHGLLGEILSRTIDPIGLAISYQHGYDLLGRSLWFQDPTGETTFVIRDTLGRITKINLADGSIATRNFSPAGNLIRRTTQDGSVVDIAYDSAGRVARLTTTPGFGCLPVPVHNFGYDGLDRIVNAKTDSTVATRQFDSLGRILKESFDGRTFERDYNDLAGKLTLKYPDDREEVHSWDLMGRVNQIELKQAGSSAVSAVSGTPGTVLLKTEYSGENRVADMTYANSVTSNWVFDNQGRLLSVDHADGSGTSLESLRYRYNAANRRRVIQLTGTPNENNFYDYDNRGRLISWKKGFALPPLTGSNTQAEQDADITNVQAAAAQATFSEEYALDGSDTRILVTKHDSGSSIVLPYSQEPGHKIISVGSDAIIYDADGRRILDASRKVTYDALGRVALIHDASGTNLLVSHKYDPFGRWSGGQIGTDIIRKFYFGDMCLQEETSGGIVLCQRTYHPSLLMPVIETRSNGPLYMHLNAHQDLQLVTDKKSIPVERYRYDVFGQPTVFDVTSGLERAESAIGLQPWFGGMQFLQPAGLYFTPERHYDPDTGLFLARDPYLHWLSPSPYVYAIHDPVNLYDPNGDIGFLVAGLIVGAIGAVIGGVARATNDPEADTWDILASAAIGFGAGFIGGATFGAASTAVAGALSGTALSAGAATTIGSVVGGGISGGLSGTFSGFSGGLYEGYRHGGDAWDMAMQGAYVEGVSGVAAGMVGGALFHGSLRLGTVPNRAMAALRGASNATSRSSVLPTVIGKGLLSPYGAGALGIGYGSAVTGGTVRGLLQGEDFTDAFIDAQADGKMALYTAPLAWLNPVTGRYWRVRLSQSALQRIESRRPGRIHHQRNFAQSPEYTNPIPRQRRVSRWTNRWDRFMNRLTEGNTRGRFSEYDSQGEHVQLHEMWRAPGQGGNWTNIPTHGPWIPEGPVFNWLAPDAKAADHTDKES